MSYRSLSFIPNFNDNNIFSNRFNQIDKMFSTLTGEKPISDKPEYNLIQIDDVQYQLTLSIPGYQEKELDISVHNNQLSIQGKKEKNKYKDERKIKWINKGIFINDFSLVFNLNYKVNVKTADLSLGLLTINFVCHIPEEDKPKKISINISNDTKKINNK